MEEVVSLATLCKQQILVETAVTYVNIHDVTI